MTSVPTEVIVPVDRISRLQAFFDPQVGSGLEIGPLHAPIVRKGAGRDIKYVDILPGAELRAYYADHPGMPVDDIVDPDYFLIGDSGTKTLTEAVGGVCFDWVIASHVVEHVPDLIGWLNQIGEILHDDGALVLAVPDRRFTFDALRPDTTVGEMLLASANHDKTPSVRAVYDHYSKVVSADNQRIWAGNEPTPADRIHDLDYVLHRLNLARSGEYTDCHVWLFTPDSFVDQLGELNRLDLVPFVIDGLTPTQPGDMEFFVRLRRLARQSSSESRRDLADAALARFSTPPPPAAVAAEPDGFLITQRERQLLEVKRRVLGTAKRAVRWRPGSASA